MAWNGALVPRAFEHYCSQLPFCTAFPSNLPRCGFTPAFPGAAKRWFVGRFCLLNLLSNLLSPINLPSLPAAAYPYLAPFLYVPRVILNRALRAFFFFISRDRRAVVLARIAAFKFVGWVGAGVLYAAPYGSLTLAQHTVQGVLNCARDTMRFAAAWADDHRLFSPTMYRTRCFVPIPPSPRLAIYPPLARVCVSFTDIAVVECVFFSAAGLCAAITIVAAHAACPHHADLVCLLYFICLGLTAVTCQHMLLSPSPTCTGTVLCVFA